MFGLATWAEEKGIPVPKTGWLARFLTGGRAKLAAGGAYDFISCGMLYVFCVSGRLWKPGYRWTLYGFICDHPDVLYATGYFHGLLLSRRGVSVLRRCSLHSVLSWTHLYSFIHPSLSPA